MTIPKDDPRLTAYALGELDADEAKAFEAEIQGDVAAQAEVEAIRAVAADLTRELADEPIAELGADRRLRLAAQAEPRGASRAWIVVPIAAVVVLGLGVTLFAVLAGGGAGSSQGRYPDAATETARLNAEAAEAAAVRFMEYADELGAKVGYNDLDGAALTDEEREAWARIHVPPPAGGQKAIHDPRWKAPPGPVPIVPIAPTAPADPADPASLPEPSGSPPADREAYDRIDENPFVRAANGLPSTFSVDVDTASYANVRRFLQAEGRLPPKGAVRIEELVNYFPYDYAPPPDDAEHPFAVHPAVAACPWAPSHRLVRIALKGKTMQPDKRPAANLVFLLDVSGSMDQPDKLPLLRQSMKLLVDGLRAEDRVAIVVYAGAAGVVLPSTSGESKPAILAALERLQAGGSTNGGAGVGLAYAIAAQNFVDGGVNRVILATDGDFNVGVSDRSTLTRMIEDKAKTGIYLSVLGFGRGNLQDATMEELSNRGNGNYAYVDSLREARKVLVEQAAGTLVTIARDVKVQVFFNPLKVAGWRLIGYENRMLRAEDFKDDTKDAGEIGAGHAVTAFYEIVPAGGEVPCPPLEDENPFAGPIGPIAPGPIAPRGAQISDALVQVKLRYKPPQAPATMETIRDFANVKSIEIVRDLFDADEAFEDAGADFQWAAAVAGFGLMLRDSEHKGACTWPLVEEIAGAARGDDDGGYRAECLQLIRLAADLAR